jgi:hypothetical protein
MDIHPQSRDPNLPPFSSFKVPAAIYLDGEIYVPSALLNDACSSIRSLLFSVSR